MYSLIYIASITPPSVWRRLKLSLLLSLVSVCEDDPDQSFPLHILIAADLNEPVLIKLLEACAGLKRNSKWILPEPKDILAVNSRKTSHHFPSGSVKDGILLSKFSSFNAKAKLKRNLEAITSKDFQENTLVNSVPFRWNSSIWVLDENADAPPSRSNPNRHELQVHWSYLLASDS